MNTGAPLRTPSGPGEVTPEWLTETLKLSRTIRCERVTSGTAEPLPQASGRVFRLGVSYDAADARAPSSFVIKFAAAAEAAVGLDDTFAYKEMEAQFYRDLALDAGLPVPQLYYDFLDSESKRSALLLQDVIHGQTGDDAGRLLGAGGARHITATGSIPRPVVGESQTGASGMAAPDVRSVQSCAPTTRPCSTPE